MKSASLWGQGRSRRLLRSCWLAWNGRCGLLARSVWLSCGRRCRIPWRPWTARLWMSTRTRFSTMSLVTPSSPRSLLPRLRIWTSVQRRHSSSGDRAGCVRSRTRCEGFHLFRCIGCNRLVPTREVERIRHGWIPSELLITITRRCFSCEIGSGWWKHWRTAMPGGAPCGQPLYVKERCVTGDWTGAVSTGGTPCAIRKNRSISLQLPGSLATVTLARPRMGRKRPRERAGLSFPRPRRSYGSACAACAGGLAGR